MSKSKGLLSAAVVAAMAFTLSCSSGGGNGNPPSSSSGLCTDFAEGTTKEHYEKSKPQFCDKRDGKKYVYVVINTQTGWRRI